MTYRALRMRASNGCPISPPRNRNRNRNQNNRRRPCPSLESTARSRREDGEEVVGPPQSRLVRQTMCSTFPSRSRFAPRRTPLNFPRPPESSSSSSSSSSDDDDKSNIRPPSPLNNNNPPNNFAKPEPEPEPKPEPDFLVDDKKNVVLLDNVHQSQPLPPPQANEADVQPQIPVSVDHLQSHQLLPPQPNGCDLKPQIPGVLVDHAQAHPVLPPQPNERDLKPQVPGVSLELRLGIREVGSSSRAPDPMQQVGPVAVGPDPGFGAPITAEKLSFKQWLKKHTQAVAARKAAIMGWNNNADNVGLGEQNNVVACRNGPQPLSDEELELKLGY